jgi:uroporphyrinogen decarboxylase
MTLNHKRRVLNLIEGKPVDRLPSDVWLSDRATTKLSKALGVPPSELFTTLDNHFVIVAPLDNHKSWEDETTLAQALAAGYFRRPADGVIVDDWGVGWDTVHEGIYELSHPLQGDADIRALCVPDPAGAHLFDPVEEAVRRYGGEYCVVGCQDLTLFERACALRGFDTFLVDLKVDTVFAERLLDAIADYQVALAEGLVSRGVDLGFTGGDYGTQHGLIISTEDWLHFEAPRLKRVWDVYRAHGIPVMHHSCGNIAPLIPHMIKMGLDILNPIQHVMDPEDLAARFGDSLVFFGGVDSQQLMTFGTPPEIEQEVARYAAVLGCGKGYIVAPDQCLLSSVPAENVMAFVRAARNQPSRRAGARTEGG